MGRSYGGDLVRLVVLISATVIAGGNCAAEGGPRAVDASGESNPIEQLQKDAEQGNVKAQYVLGCCYNGDHGYPRDPAKAAKWWEKAAENGYADAEFCVGLICFQGEGVPRDVAAAAKWWRKAADSDQPDAEYFLGLIYHAGLGVPKSAPLALYWLQRSAVQGSTAAIKLLKEIGNARG